jgi:hypothetical protein
MIHGQPSPYAVETICFQRSPANFALNADAVSDTTRQSTDQQRGLTGAATHLQFPLRTKSIGLSFTTDCAVYTTSSAQHHIAFHTVSTSPRTLSLTSIGAANQSGRALRRPDEAAGCLSLRRSGRDVPVCSAYSRLAVLETSPRFPAPPIEFLLKGLARKPDAPLAAPRL